jgi:acyl transferase domain-containing protein/NAD(P)-dependent dehydrogenase (short-subunit alcohol dehydrogenase family)/pimeloyl-ACP methyl ester carboxylesterase/aryl carrier-like protein
MPQGPIRCRLLVPHADFILQHHQVHGTSVMPGVTFSDVFLRILIARGVDASRAVIRDILFLEPLATADGIDREVLVSIDGADVEASSRAVIDGMPAGEWTQHLTAKLTFEDGEPSPDIDVEAWKAGACDVLDMADLYARARAEDIVHGDPMRCTGQIFVRGEGLLAELELDPSARGYESRFYLHPAALDASTLVAFARTPVLDAPFIPISLAMLRAPVPLCGRFYVHVPQQELLADSGDVMHNSYAIHDAAGRWIADVSRLSCKRIRFPRLITSLVDAPAAKPSHDYLTRHLRDLVGRALNVEAEQVSTTAGFYDQGLDSMAMLRISQELEPLVGARLYPTLLFEFRNIEDLVRHLGDTYGHAAAIGPVSEVTVFRRVWQEVPRASRGPRQELSLVTADASRGEMLAAALRAAGHRVAVGDLRHDTVVVLGSTPERAFNELLSTAQALIERRPVQPVRLLFVGTGDGDMIPPEYSAIGAAARTMAAETPILRCRSVAIDGATDLAESVVRELESGEDECEVRYRRGRRELPRLATFTLDRSLPTPLRQHGVYLLVGGTGGLGRKLANYLARRYHARMLLVARHPPDAELGEQLEAYRSAGAEATYVRADVTQLLEAQMAVAEARRLYGKIDGVFHLAGEISDSLFFRKSPAGVDAVIGPKVRGSYNLDRATQEDSLDLFVLFSSLSAVVANPGQSDYAYANAFLDAFATWRQRARTGRTVAIGWTYWADGGMRVASGMTESDRDGGLEPLPDAAALEVLEPVLAAGEPHVVVAHGAASKLVATLSVGQDTSVLASPGDAPEGAAEPDDTRSGDIAIIGLAGRYPQAPDVASFWRNLAAGHDSITEIPADRWQHDRYYDQTRGKRGKTYSRWGGFLDGIDQFARTFFSVSRREAERMDPQERLCLETAWHALEDAGYPPETLEGERVGVFAGVMWSHYQLYDDEGVAPTSLHSSVANRVSYAFDFSGPSLAVNTACSSSLVALHLAVESIRSGDSTMALVGGVNVHAHPQKYLQLADEQFLADDGRCRAFGKGGTGYVPGEGCGVLVLKPLARAVADGDHIEGVIKGSAVNHGGRTSGYTVPDPTSQSVLIREAIRRSGVDAASICYIEAHGTGTSLGDPIEIDGLRKAFANVPIQPGRRTIGSVKSNIGHLESAAGVAAVTKVLLQMRHRTLVPSLHVAELNPHIDFSSSPFTIQRELAPWRAVDGHPLRAGVSAFGAGGTNAHVILESPPARTSRITALHEPQLVICSASNGELLRALARSLLDAIEALCELGSTERAHELPRLEDVAFTLQIGRRSLEVRLAVVVEDFAALRAALQRFLDSGHPGSDGYLGTASGAGTRDPECVTLFRAGRVREVAARWVGGASVDWRACTAGASRRRVSLPGTPLLEERCWIGDWNRKDGVAASPAVHRQPVELQILDAGIAVVTMRTDGHGNMITDELLHGLEQSFATIAARPELKVVILTGTEQVFCMGGTPAALEMLAARQGTFTDAAFVYEGLLNCDRPVIAAVCGHAAGGGLAMGLYADIIVMSREGSYAANFLKYGFTPGMGASYILERRFGAALAAEMLLTGRGYRGDELERRGAQVSFETPDQVLPRALSLARSIAEMPSDASRVLKKELARRTLSALSHVIPSEVTMHERVLGDAAVERVRQHFTAEPRPQVEMGTAATPPTPILAARVARADVIARIETSLSSILYLDRREIKHSQSFHDLGVDSIGVVELVRDLNHAFGIDLDSTTVYDEPTVSRLADRVLSISAKQAALHAELIGAPHGSPPERPTAAPAAERPFRVTLAPIAPREPLSLVVEPRGDDIAVVGMSGQFPDAPDLDAWWRNLAEGKNSIREIPAERWDVSAVFDAEPGAEGKTYSRWGALLSEVDKFDHRFFNLSPREAEEMDPQQRLFLTEAWKALEHAGYAGAAGEGTRAGVFVGCAPGDYGQLLDRAGRGDSAQAFLGNSGSILAARVAYFLDFHGPTVAVDTACSSSLVAVHLACQSLRAGEVDLALAGGVALMLTPSLHVRSSRVGLLSPTGTSAPFSANGDGIVLGEGVGVVVLKRLADVARDRDHVIGVIRASGINGDGRTNGITAPSATAQAALVRRVHEQAGVEPRDIGYVEGHGTGTALGDPIEFEALSRVFGRDSEARVFCGLGSVKGNIGHTTMSAGIAGLLKVLLALRHGKLPPTVGFTTINPEIDLAGSPFFMIDRLRDWPVNMSGERIAAVSSFGFSGTNCHLVVAGSPPEPERRMVARREMIPVSARTESEFETLLHRLADALTSSHDVGDVAFTMSTGRRHLAVRAAVVANHVDELRDKLRALAKRQVVESCWRGRVDETDASKVPPESGTSPADLAVAHVGGQDIDWAVVFRGRPVRRVVLPCYPLGGSRHWIGGGSRSTSAGGVLHPDDPLVADHQVEGQRVLAGAVSIELVVAEAERRGWSLPIRLGRIRWLRPFVVERPIAVELELTDRTYRIGDKAQPHGTGMCESIELEQPQLDLAAARSRCARRVDIAALYRSFEASGLRYGPSFRLLSAIEAGDGELVATLVRPAVATVTVPAAILDGAFQAVAVLVDHDDVTPLVPVAVRSLDVHASLATVAHAVVRRRSNLEYDIDVIDAAGRVLVRVSGLALRPMLRTSSHMFVPVWRRAPPLVARPVTNVGATILHRSSTRPLAEALAQRLGYAPTVLVLYGDDDELDLSSLASSLGTIYLLASDRDDLFVLFRLVKALLAAGRERDPVTLKVVTRGSIAVSDSDNVLPQTAALHGFTRTIAAEYPRWHCGCVDLDVLSDHQQDAKRIADEDCTARLVVLRSEQRLVRGFKPARVSPSTVPILRERGVYVILGGTGGIGYALSLHLAARCKARLLWIGRRSEDEHIRAQLAAVARTGGEAIYLQADASDVSQMTAVITRARRHFGVIHGAVHSAGVLRDRTLANMTLSDLEAVLVAKVTGSINLHHALSGDALDFLHFFSSAAALIDVPGQSNYAAASAFEDAYAIHLRRNGVPASVINWGYWGSVGAVADEHHRSLLAADGVGSLEPATAFAALERISGMEQVLIIEASAAGLAHFGIGTPQRTQPVAVAEPIVIAYVRRVFADVLKFPEQQLDPHSTFEQFGVDSIIATEIVARLGSDLGRLPATLLFEEMTIERLARRLIADRSPQLAALLSADPPESIHSDGTVVPNARVEVATDDIAVIGVVGRYPGAPDLDTFWHNLAAGLSSVSEVPADRWDWRTAVDERQGPQSWQRWGGFLDDVASFDAELFNVLPRDAANIDPQERLFLEICWSLLEQTGYLGQSHEPDTGVVVGIMYGTYGEIAAQAWSSGELSGAHSAYWSVANRVSYTFDFHGPSFAVDSACSSSLTAVHLACESIRRGDCRMAIAGGVNLILHPAHLASLGSRNMLAPDGVAKVFDASANGYVPGEGVGAVLLKALGAAVADGDEIWAVIRGGAVNAGGKTSGYTVPNPNAQASLVETALRRARVDPSTITYVEAHGTGTELGDPIEIAGLVRAFRSNGGAERHSSFGSVKSNIGHLEGAAGIAGLTKVLLQLRHGQLAPTVNFESLNSKIELRGTGFEPQTVLARWPQNGIPRRAGVSSFGAGGANAHLIVEEWRTPRRPSVPDGREHVFVLSAPTHERLVAHMVAVAEFLVSAPQEVTLADLAFTSQLGRRAFQRRLAFAVTSREDLMEALRAGAPRQALNPVLRSLAARWAAGEVVDWNQLWPEPARRVAFPSLPLSRKRYWLRETQTANAAAQDTHVRYERSIWQRAALPETTRLIRRTLVVTADTALAEAVERRLDECGIEPTKDADAKADAIVYIGTGDLDRGRVDHPFYTVFNLAVDRFRRFSGSPMRLLCARIVRTGEEQPQLAALTGLIQTLAQEHPSTCSGALVALEPEPPSTIAARIVDELRATGSEGNVAWRGGVRFVLTPSSFEAPAPIRGYVRPDAAYLITGGAGALGLEFAELLARRGAGEIVLVGRSAPDPRVLARITKLRDGGQSFVRYERADVTREDEITRVVSELRRSRRLCGVIHAAGCIRDARAVDKTPEQLAAVLGPKLVGTLNLDRVTSDDPLDFFVLFSSIVGHTGNPGQADYAYASAFLDAFAETRERWRAAGRRQGRSMSIAWPLWRNGGMQIDAASVALLERRWGMVPMSTDTGLTAFESLLEGSDTVVLVVEERATRHGVATPVLQPAPPVLPGVPVEQAGVRRLAELAAGFLLVDVEEVDVDAPLIDAGFDSISMTELISSINRTLELELHVAVLFEYPTMRELAAHIERLSPHSLAPAVPAGRSADTDVAVIGMAGHFTGSADLDEFWSHLVAGHHLVRSVPSDREALLANPRTREITAGFIDGVAEFDAALFTIAPREAMLMDPQQRLFLQVVWHAFADAGYRPSDFAGTATGVFTGVSTSDYNDLLTRSGVPEEAHTATGISHAILSNRVSYCFNLIGPSEAIDTACSSSLVAVHRAIRALRSGECDSAIAGGVSVALTPGLFIAFADSGMLSPDGRCRTFDHNANGYVRGEGVGVVLLKRLDRALADGDHIHAIIKGSAVNHGGRAASLTAPNPRGQAAVLRAAYADANVDIASITYLEAHGTGTRLGDPVEIEGIKMALGSSDAEQAPIAIGSVKTNIGHLEAAAGIAGLLKVLLAIRHGQLPPHLHLEQLNPLVRLEGTRLTINDRLRAWPERPVRRAGVSSFGFGGTNAHVVVEAAPKLAAGEARGPLVFPLSAPDARRLALYAQALAARLEADADVELHAVAYVLQNGRTEQLERYVVVTSRREQLIADLRDAAAGVHRGDPDSMAAAWLRGDTVDWRSRWSSTPRRVPLPTFPLERTRYWTPSAPVASREAAGSEIADVIRFYLGEILQIAPASVAGNRPFADLGVDSIFAMDLSDKLSKKLDIDLPAATLYDHDTVDALAAFLGAPPLAQVKPVDILADVVTNVMHRSFDRAGSFVDNGITSIDMLRIVSELELELGTLPKTLLFDHPNLTALTAHLVSTYGAEMVRGLGADRETRKAVTLSAESTIIAKREIPVGSRLAMITAELARKYEMESGLAGRDIAPLLFLGAREQGYLEFSRSRDRLLVWSYTGPPDELISVVEELVVHSRAHQLRISLLLPVRLEHVENVAFSATPFGVVQQIEDLRTFSLKGTKMRRLRSLVRCFAQVGDAAVTEYVPGSDPRIDGRIVELIDAWAAGKSAVNPYVHTLREELGRGDLSVGHRVFLTVVGETIVAAVIITKMHSVAGYLLDAEFYDQHMPLGGLEFSIVEILEILAAEGVAIFSLGATFGLKVCDSPNASLEVEKALDELQSVGVLGRGNYQFKSKFRPSELPIYLCQPVDQPTSVADVLLMIASPEREAAEASASKLTMPHAAFDLLTDSWAERDDPWIGERMRALAEMSIAGSTDTLRQPWLPFTLVIPTPSGRSAEALLCRSWPGRHGLVLHNGLFPTWIFNLAEQRFTPEVLPGLGDGVVAVEALADRLTREHGVVSFIVIELSNNAAGGRALTLACLRRIREVAAAHGVSLVFDATRIVENAVVIADEQQGDPWQVMREVLSLADAATFSLSKDWGVNFGGLVGSRIAALDQRLQEQVNLRGVDVNLAGRRQLQAALSDVDTVLALVRQRLAAVQALWQQLSDAGAPVVGSPGSHCVLLDAGQIPTFAQQPIEAFVEWVGARSECRIGPHLAGDAYPHLRKCGRLAVPLGMTVEDASRAGARIAELFEPSASGERWFTRQLGELRTRFTSSAYTPANQNLDLLRTFVPNVECRLMNLAEGEVEVFSAGAGPTLLLMQPFNIGAGIFAPLFDQLSDRFHVIVIHQPGVGRTRVGRSLGLDSIVNLQQKVLAELGVHEPVHVAGASVGAIFAQYFALRFADITLSLSLLGGSYRFANRKGQIDRLEQVVAEDFDAIVAGCGSSRIIAERERMTQFLLLCESMDPQTGLRYLDLFANDPGLASRLGQIAAPTLILQGRYDTVVGVTTGKFLADAIPNAKYVELPESGHFICVSEPEAVVREMTTFFSDLSAAYKRS